MPLTDRQERLIGRYLFEVGAALGDVSEAVRERVVARLRLRILVKLRESGRSPVQDKHVVEVLTNLGSPARAAIGLLDAEAGAGGLVLSVGDRQWLGVCAGVADYVGVAPGTVRLVAVVLGITGPIALLAYLALYFEMYLSSESPKVPRIDKARFARRVLGALAAAVALDVGTRIFRAITGEVYVRLAGEQAMPALGKWGWLEREDSLLIFCVVFLLVPIAALSGLPLANRWDHTGKRLVQAGLALYVVVLSLGIASFLVGLILGAVESFLA